MTFLLWYDNQGTMAERALRAAAAYCAKLGRWPAIIHAHPLDLPGGSQVIAVSEGQTVRLEPAAYVLRDHLHVGEGS